MLMEAFQRYTNDGLVLLGINYTVQDSLEEAEAFVNALDITFPILLDEQGHVSRDAYGIIGLPTSVFIDRAGVVRRVIIGPVVAQQIDQYIAEILTENA